MIWQREYHHKTQCIHTHTEREREKERAKGIHTKAGKSGVVKQREIVKWRSGRSKALPLMI